MQTAAGNESEGNLAASGIGIGLGAGAGMAVGNSFAADAGSVVNTPSKTTSCNRCGETNAQGVKFCSSCGEKIAVSKIECFSCKTFIDENMKFCPVCGCSMLKKVCPSCNAENLPGTKFCSDCGTKLEGANE
ncbi:MAG: zinc ribbon domain-containing protein [Clostridiaceae bacterium]